MNTVKISKFLSRIRVNRLDPFQAQKAEPPSLITASGRPCRRTAPSNAPITASARSASSSAQPVTNREWSSMRASTKAFCP